MGFYVLEPDVDSLLDSFFFRLITVTTIGYGNIVPSTTSGKLLAIGTVLSGVGSATVVLQSAFEVFLGRRIKEELNLPDKKTEKRDHHIICGCGETGKAVMRRLEAQNRDFVTIENDETKVTKEWLHLPGVDFVYRELGRDCILFNHLATLDPRISDTF